MILLLNLIKIEIKRVLRFLPHIVAGALALCFIVGIISYSASKALYEKKDRNKVNIAISIPKDDSSSELLISIMKEMKSVKENCNFVEVDNEETAYKKVENGEVYGAIILPKHFVRDILDGTNTPATVLFPNKSSIESMLIKDLIDSGTKSLASAEAGIYVVNYEYEKAYHEELTKTLQDNINVKYMDHTLQRENYFNHDKVSATGELTTIEYYICSGVILFMLLLGMSFSKYLSPNNNTFYEKLESYGITKGIVVFTKIISVFIMYMIIAFLASFIYAIVCRYLDISMINLKITGFLSLLLVILCVSSFVVCIYYITESQISGTLLLFIVTISMNFISGGFLPTVFLPKVIQNLAPYMLTNTLSKEVGNIFLEEFNMKEFLTAIGMLGAIYATTAIIIILKKQIGRVHNINFRAHSKRNNGLKELVKKKVGK